MRKKAYVRFKWVNLLPKIECGDCDESFQCRTDNSEIKNESYMTFGRLRPS